MEAKDRKTAHHPKVRRSTLALVTSDDPLLRVREDPRVGSGSRRGPSRRGWRTGRLVPDVVTAGGRYRFRWSSVERQLREAAASAGSDEFHAVLDFVRTPSVKPGTSSVHVRGPQSGALSLVTALLRRCASRRDLCVPHSYTAVKWSRSGFRLPRSAGRPTRTAPQRDDRRGGHPDQPGRQDQPRRSRRLCTWARPRCGAEELDVDTKRRRC